MLDLMFHWLLDPEVLFLGSPKKKKHMAARNCMTSGEITRDLMNRKVYTCLWITIP